MPTTHSFISREDLGWSGNCEIPIVLDFPDIGKTGSPNNRHLEIVKVFMHIAKDNWQAVFFLGGRGRGEGRGQKYFREKNKVS